MAQTPRLNSSEARKEELISSLAASRESLSTNLQETLHDLNVAEHLRHSILRRKTAWFTGAAVTGALLSWIFGRKKRKKPALRSHPQVTRVELSKNTYTGLALALLTFLFNLLKPSLERLASRKIAQIANRQRLDW